ncbi:hypothetical protein K8R62_03735 [bacterium]|nr:hypothetical protein [bacterium]
MNKNNLPKIKKDISRFLNSEEGRVNKKDIPKIAMRIVALGIGLAGLINPSSGNAASTHASHGSHSSHASHASHASHSSK